MCTGFEIAALVLAAAGTTYGVVQADEAASQARENAQKAYEADMEQLNLQRTQIDQQTTEKMSEVAKQEQAKMAQLRVAAGESGVQGVSVDRAEGELEMSGSQSITEIMANRNHAMQQTKATAAQSAAQAINRANSVRGGDWGAAALQIGGTVANMGAKQKRSVDTTGTDVSTGSR